MSIHSMVGAQVLPSARSETAVRQCTARKPFVLACAHGKQQPQRYVPKAACEVAQHLVGGLAAAAVLLVPQAAMANARLPPVDSDPNRCERAFVGNTLGMANAVSDKLLDLRGCVYTGKNLADKVLSGALASDADFSKTVMSNVTMTKSYAKGANFSGADLTNAVLDRVDFTDANLSSATFTNAVITGAKFGGANLDGATFEDALIGQEDYKQLCLNPTVTGETRVSIGCKTIK
ncbi:hypothetical protein ABBQ32_013128 [Trebouxia sp. C0010 RCD-2024]